MCFFFTVSEGEKSHEQISESLAFWKSIMRVVGTNYEKNIRKLFKKLSSSSVIPRNLEKKKK